MVFTDSVFIGIDPTSGRTPFTFAAVDKQLNLLGISDGEIEDVTTFLAEQKSATVAVNAPTGVNRGLGRAKKQKDMINPHQIGRAELLTAAYEFPEHCCHSSGATRH